MQVIRPQNNNNRPQTFGRAGGRARPVNSGEPGVFGIGRNRAGGRARFSQPNNFNPGSGGTNPPSPPSGRPPIFGFGKPNDNNRRKKPTALFGKKPTNTGDANMDNFDKRRQTQDKVNPNNGAGNRRSKRSSNWRNGNGNGGGNSSGSGGNNGNNNNNRGGSSMNRRRGGNGGGSGNYNDTIWTADTQSNSYGTASWYSVNRSDNGTTEFNSGTRSGLIFNKAQSDTAVWSPLIVSGGEFFPPYTVTTTGQNYLFKVAINDIYYECLRVCQLEINRVITTDFTLSDWYNYMYTVCKAIQLYYLYDSIQVYVADPDNQNVALTDIYNVISPEGWNNFSRLKLDLSKHYMKPEMVNFLMFMYQHFTPDEGTPTTIYKMSWNNLLNSGLTDVNRFRDGGEIVATLVQLNSATNLKIAAYMSRGFESWRIRELKASYSKPIYSKNFLTFWNNMNISFADLPGSNLFYSKIVIDRDTNYPYYLKEDDVDGVIYACNSLSLESGPVSQLEAGMWVPSTTMSDILADPDKVSLLHWSNGFIRSLTDDTNLGHTGVSNPVRYNVSGPSFGTVGISIPGFKPVITDSIDNLAMAANDGYRYLLYPNSRPTS